QRYFKGYGGLFRKSLRSAHKVFVQDETSEGLLRAIGLDQVEIAGDTRFDRVADVAENARSFDLIRQFKGGDLLVILGSSWEPEEKMMAEFMSKSDYSFKLIIAPHEVEESHLVEIESRFEATKRYSQIIAGELEECRVLIIDNVGMLNKLYRDADVAFVGGGFGKGLHNTLEAAVFGVPLLIGPNHHQFREAVDLVEVGGAFVVEDDRQLHHDLNALLVDGELRHRAGEACRNYVGSRLGATELIFSEVKRILGAG
ncbi:MAG: 3-deoxy-D-manno-octulosonic acid transferase, partial [Flavobacteriales bacterium]|nr:3-deoxy-D-manno-octulosonic acid transferase [Flavobacteriales bacterium]